MQPWPASFALLVRWRLLRLGLFLPVIVVLQAVLSLGVVYGLPLLLPHIDATTALYLCTGAPTLVLLLAGLAIVPQETAMARQSGAHDYLRTLPVPPLAHVAAQITVWTLTQLPGVVLALVLGTLRFHFTLHISPLVIPVTALVAITSSAVGYAIAVGLPVPMVTVMAQFVSLMLLLFSPINFPLDRLPLPLRAVHQALPVEGMADLMRWSLTGSSEQAVLGEFLVVTAWCLAALWMCRRVALARG